MRSYRNNFVFLISILILLSNDCTSQVMVPSISRMQGIWVLYGSEENGYEQVTIIRSNKSIEIGLFKTDNKAFISGNPYLIFGFNNSCCEKNIGKNINQLSDSGLYRIIYWDLNKGFDSTFNLKSNGTTELVHYNGNDGEYKEMVGGRDYFYITDLQSRNSIFVKTDTIPTHLINALKGTEYWKIYTDFIKLFTKRVISTKAIIYKSINNPTSRSILLNEKIEIIEVHRDWYRFQGIKPNTNGWIKKSDVEPLNDFVKPDPKITITTQKSFFYQDASESKPKKSFLLKGDIAFVEETKGDWLFIRFEGKTTTRGWMHKKNVQYLK